LANGHHHPLHGCTTRADHTCHHHPHPDPAAMQREQPVRETIRRIQEAQQEFGRTPVHRRSHLVWGQRERGRSHFLFWEIAVTPGAEPAVVHEGAVGRDVFGLRVWSAHPDAEEHSTANFEEEDHWERTVRINHVTKGRLTKVVR